MNRSDATIGARVRVSKRTHPKHGEHGSIVNVSRAFVNGAWCTTVGVQFYDDPRQQGPWSLRLDVLTLSGVQPTPHIIEGDSA